MTSPEFDEIADYKTQAEVFLARSQEYLAAGDLHQASEKGWGAAAHMAKAVAVAQGWEYRKHRDFVPVMNQARRVADNPRLLDLRGRAESLHDNFYERKRRLDAEIIGEDIESVAELLDLLSPLTDRGPGR